MNASLQLLAAVATQVQRQMAAIRADGHRTARLARVNLPGVWCTETPIR